MTLYNLKQKVRNIKQVDDFVHWLQETSLFPYLYWMLYLCHLEDFSHLSNLEETLQKSRSYFKDNQAKIDTILTNLADKKSKQVFAKQLIYRQYGKPLTLGTPQDHYFPKDIVRLSKDEVFVDCGAFTGDTLLRFQKRCKNNYKKMVAFEASPDTFAILKAKNLARCDCFCLGVWNKKDFLSFSAEADHGAKLSSTVVERLAQKTDEKIQIPVEAIDNIAQCADATFIKMDVEGAELNALKGAEKTIRKNVPTLAISIYHSDNDLLEIPLWIMSLGLNYRYYVRHHGVAFCEVTFYAIPC